MPIPLKYNTVATVVLGPFLDATDGVTAETALTLSQADIRLSKNAAAFAQGANTTNASHMENGYYSKGLRAADVDTVGHLRIAVNESGALPVWQDYVVLPALVYDSVVGGTDNLQVDTIQVGGTSQTAGDIIGDTNDIQTRLPAALVSGRMDSNTQATAASLSFNLTGNITGNLSGSVGSVTGAVGSVTGAVGSVTGAVGSVTGAVGSVTGAVGSVTGNVGGNVTGSVGSLATQAKADVNAEVLDVLNTDTFAEPGQEAPGATTTLQKKISYLYKAFRNKITQDATTLKLYADDGSTVDQKSTVSDDGSTYTRGELATGP